MASDDSAFETLVAALPTFLPQHRILPLPPWDSPSSERTPPSRAVTGKRVASLAWLAEAHDQPGVVVTTPEAVPQRVPIAERLRERAVTLAAGEDLDPDWLCQTLEAFGYAFEERVDQPGEAAVRAGAVDICAAGEREPVRLELEAGRKAGAATSRAVSARRCRYGRGRRCRGVRACAV